MSGARTISLLALGILSASCTNSAESLSAECAADGSSILSSVSAEGFDVVVFGETHGNSQSPRIFFDFVCQLAKESAPILVGVEMPPSSVDAVRDATRRDGTGVFGDKFWAESRDGRSSSANLELIERLVRLETEGYIRLVGFDKRVNGKEDFGRSSLAALESKAHTGKEKEKWLLLTGRGHSKYYDEPSSLTYALVDSGRSTNVVDITFTTGTTWACVMGECKVQQTGNNECKNSLNSRDFASGTRLQITNQCIDSATASAPAADSARNIDK